MSDLISRADAIDAICKAWCYTTYGMCPHDDGYCKGCDEIKAIEALPSADATKKKAELKENGDWDCPDVYCDECDHHRSVEWCSLAIPNHEEIDDTYKMVTEAFFEGVESAEKENRLLIEILEELEEKSADAVEVVRCKDCRDSRVYGKTTQWLACENVMEGQATDPDGYCYLGKRREESEVEE